MLLWALWLVLLCSVHVAFQDHSLKWTLGTYTMLRSTKSFHSERCLTYPWCPPRQSIYAGPNQEKAGSWSSSNCAQCSQTNNSARQSKSWLINDMECNPAKSYSSVRRGTSKCRPMREPTFRGSTAAAGVHQSMPMTDKPSLHTDVYMDLKDPVHGLNTKLALTASAATPFAAQPSRTLLAGSKSQFRTAPAASCRQGGDDRACNATRLAVNGVAMAQQNNRRSRAHAVAVAVAAAQVVAGRWVAPDARRTA